MSGPIKPNEVAKRIAETLPDEVFEAFNELICENWSISGATVKQNAVVDRIVSKLNCERSYVFAKGYLNIEAAYKKAGWCVGYDKPGYNESYEAYFSFNLRSQS